MHLTRFVNDIVTSYRINTYEKSLFYLTIFILLEEKNLKSLESITKRYIMQ